MNHVYAIALDECSDPTFARWMQNEARKHPLHVVKFLFPRELYEVEAERRAWETKNKRRLNRLGDKLKGAGL